MKKIQCVKSLLNKIPFSLHPAFVVVLAYCVIFGSFWSFITLTFLALVHELGHGVVAAHFGYKLKKIRLLPFGAELCGNDLFLPAHEIKIAIAGPATNLVICVVCIALMWVFPSAYSNLEIIFSSSISLALFNLLPFFPLDGGRIFVALSSKRMERQVALRLARILTIIFGSILLLLFVVSIFIYFNLSFGIMGISLIMSCIFSLPTTKYERFTSQSFKYRKIKTGLLQKHIAISLNSTIISAFANVDARTQTIFCVQDEFGTKIMELGEADIEKAITEGGAYKKIGEYFNKNN